MTDFASIIASAQRLISANGRSCTLVARSTSVSDQPWKPTANDTHIQVVGCFLPASGSDFGTDIATDEMISRVTEVVLVAPGSSEYSGIISIIDGDTYAVQWERKLRPASDTLMYFYGLKR